MIKNYFFVILAAVTMLLVSCGNSQTTPQEIDGVEFIGNGLLGNFPYMMARYDSERANLERNLNGAGVLEKRNFAKENEFDIEKIAEELDGKEVPFEISTGGKTEEIKGFKFKVVKCVGGYLPCLKIRIEGPAGYDAGWREKGIEACVPVDKDGNILNFHESLGRFWLHLGSIVGAYSYPLRYDKNYDEMLQRNHILDRFVKIVAMDEETFEKTQAKMREAEEKALNEEAKDNDLSKVEFSEKGCEPIILGKKVNQFPSKCKGFYTHYRWNIDKLSHTKNFTFFNGTDTVVHVESDLSSAEIYKIFVCSPKINVKFENGKTLRAGMKLVDVAQMFGDDFKASWTPEEIAPFIHFGLYGGYPADEETLKRDALKHLEELYGCFEYLYLSPKDVLPNAVLESVILCLHE